MTLRSTRGFNLLEMIIASAVFCSIVVALLGVWANNAWVLRRDSNKIMASTIAQNVMESQISLGYKADLVPETAFDVTHFVDDNPSVVHYKYRVDVQDRSTGPEDVALKECRVTVSWEEDGHVKTLELESLVSWQS